MAEGEGMLAALTVRNPVREVAPLAQLRRSLDGCLSLAGDNALLLNQELAPLREKLFLVPAALQEVFTDESRKMVKNLERRMQQYQLLDTEEVALSLGVLRDDLARYQSAAEALCQLSQALQSHLVGLQLDAGVARTNKEALAALHAVQKEQQTQAAKGAQALSGVLALGALVAVVAAAPVAAGWAVAGSVAAALGSQIPEQQSRASAEAEGACRQQAQLLANMLGVAKEMESAARWMRDLFYDVQTQLADDLGDMEQLAIYAPLDAASPGVRSAVRMHHLNMKRKAPNYIQSCQAFQAAMHECGRAVLDVNARVGAGATQPLLRAWCAEHAAAIRVVRAGAEA